MKDLIDNLNLRHETALKSNSEWERVQYLCFIKLGDIDEQSSAESV